MNKGDETREAPKECRNVGRQARRMMVNENRPYTLTCPTCQDRPAAMQSTQVFGRFRFLIEPWLPSGGPCTGLSSSGLSSSSVEHSACWMTWAPSHAASHMFEYVTPGTALVKGDMSRRDTAEYWAGTEKGKTQILENNKPLLARGAPGPGGGGGSSAPAWYATVCFANHYAGRYAIS